MIILKRQTTVESHDLYISLPVRIEDTIQKPIL